AQAQVRLELATVKDGKFYHKWSDNPDNPNSWSDWTSLGHPVGHVLFSTPAVVSDGVGRINFFAWGDDGLYRNTYNDNNGSWSSWIKVPGQNSQGLICDIGGFSGCWLVSSSPAVASWGPGRMDLLLYAHIGGANALLHTWADNHSWSGRWEILTLGGT